MLVVALISGGIYAGTSMRVDIFPSLNVPKIYVFLDYIGMSPDQMEGFIVNELELYFQYVDGIQGHQYAEHSAGGLVRALVLQRHRHGPGDGPGGGDVGPGDVVDAQGNLAADDHAHGRRQRARRLPCVREHGNFAGGDGRPGAEHHPAAGAAERSRHGRDLAVRAEHAVDRRECRSQQASRLQPDSAAGDRGPGDGEHGHSGGQRLHQRLDADGREQRDGRRHPEAGQYPAAAGAERLPSRRGDHPGLRRHHVRICARQRQEFGLSADHQERHGINPDRGGRHQQERCNCSAMPSPRT